MQDVHLINPMRNPAGGSEHRTLALFELIGEETGVQVWSEEEPHTAFLGAVPIRKVGPPNRFPRGGNLVFIGTYFSVGGWIRASEAKRLILIHNLNQPERLREVFGVLQGMGLPRPEVVYASQAIAQSTPEIPGVVHESPIDLSLFSPAPNLPPDFTVGRLSRDVPDKHHPNDPQIYRQLAEAGIKVRIMGGTNLDIQHPNIELLPENAEPASTFLQSLSCFFYRTHPAWQEAYGRVIFEAMACGLPVVAESRHGYAEKLSEGEALLVDEDQEALEAVLRLKGDAGLCQHLGASGRAKVEAIYGPEYRTEMQNFYSH